MNVFNYELDNKMFKNIPLKVILLYIFKTFLKYIF